MSPLLYGINNDAGNFISSQGKGMTLEECIVKKHGIAKQ